MGITSPESMQDLPYGWVADVKDLRPPEEEPEGFYISYQVTMNKAWPLVSHLRESRGTKHS